MSAVDTRLNWNDYFMSIAHKVKTRSTCLSRQVGAVLVRDKRILATGYNGAPAGVSHCVATGCLRKGDKSGTNLENCKALHAEQNCILQCALHGVSAKGADLICTMSPCSTCAKMIINAGIVRVIYEDGYPDEFGIDLLKEAEVQLIQWGYPMRGGDAK